MRINSITLKLKIVHYLTKLGALFENSTYMKNMPRNLLLRFMGVFSFIKNYAMVLLVSINPHSAFNF